MRSGKAYLFAIILAFIPAYSFAICDNRPQGSTVLLDCPFTNSNCGGQLWEIYPGAGQTVTDLSAPVSPPSVNASILSPGATTGGQQTIWPKQGSQQPLTNTYVCFQWKMNSQFVGIRTANKLVFVAAQDFTYGRASNNAYFGVRPINTSNYPASAMPMYMFFGHNSGNLDNSHTCALDLGLECTPNVTSTPLYADTWYTVEIHSIASSTLTSRNGTVKWWINGTLNGSYTDLNYGDGIINQFQINHTWDNSAAIQCYDAVTNPKGRDCTNPQIHYFDHVKIASVIGLPAGASVGSGGTTPPSPPPSPTPPPPSPTPPPPSGTPGTVSDLAVVPLSSTTARVTFTQQDDGTGVAAKYDNRLAVSPISWGAASSVMVGPCASPYAPSGIIGSQVSCDLSGLTPGQAYQMQNVAFRGTMNAGATYGSLGNIASFTMPSSNVPTITNFTPATGQAGTSITITGTNFGATIGSNTVKCNGQTATITAASPTSLTITAPDGVTTGKISVQTDQGIVYSEQNFTVGAQSNGCGCS